MIPTTLTRAIKNKKPALVRENGKPRFVVLDWDVYKIWEEKKEDLEDHVHFEIAERESRGKRRYSLVQLKKKYRLR